MDKTNYKILFFINTPTSYQLDFFSELKKFCNLKIIFYSKNYTNYKFDIKKQKNFFFLEDKPQPIFQIKKIIYNFKPDFTIIGGYRLKYLNKIIQFTKANNKKYFFWLERINPAKKLKFKLVNYLIKNKVKKSDGLFCVGNIAKKNYRNFSNNVYNLPYSININKFRNKKKYFLNKKINFLFVGQLIERKGINIILNSLRNLNLSDKNKITFTIVGDGPYKKNIINLKKNFKFIKYKSFLNQKKLIPIFLKSDVFIFPSIFDGWGVAPIEAMASKMCIIISKNVGMTEILNKNRSKIINYSSQDLSSTMKNMIYSPSNIMKDGSDNYKLIKYSLCNVKYSTKYFLKYLKKIKKY